MRERAEVSGVERLDTNVKVRTAAEADLSRLALLLAQTFREDPGHRWLLPTESDWSRYSERFWRALLRPRIRDETVFTTDGVHGVSLWYSPQRTQMGELEALRVIWAVLPVLCRRLRLFSRGTRLLDAAHPRSPHWYLFSIGTIPEHRGQGVGSALLRPILERCDADGTPAYLESSHERNIPLYERHGFEVRGEIQLPNGPTIWPMLRRAMNRQ